MRPAVLRGSSRLVRVSAGSALAVLAIGLLHTPWARPLLQRIGGCPVAHLTPRQVEMVQGRAWRTLRGTAPAPARPALGFVLERTTLPKVRAWARERRISCDVKRDGALLLCAPVPASAVPAGGAADYDELAFGFRLADQRLVNLTTLRTGLDAGAAAADLGEIAAGLQRALGAPTRVAGESEPALVQYRYTDYLADVSAIELPTRGHVLREHYMAGLN